MQMHASCVARDGAGVLLLGPSGSGKSDMALRLLDHGFLLVADDRVEIADGWATCPPAIAGLLELRGLGIFRFPHTARAKVVLAAMLGPPGERMPEPARHATLDVPLIPIDPRAPSAPHRLTVALDCVLGRVAHIAGALA